MITSACSTCPVLVLLTMPQHRESGGSMDTRTFAAALWASALLPPNVQHI